MRSSSWLALPHRNKPRPSSRPSLELLEDRLVPSTVFTQTNLVTDNQATRASLGSAPAGRCSDRLKDFRDPRGTVASRQAECEQYPGLWWAEVIAGNDAKA